MGNPSGQTPAGRSANIGVARPLVRHNSSQNSKSFLLRRKMSSNGARASPARANDERGSIRSSPVGGTVSCERSPLPVVSPALLKNCERTRSLDFARINVDNAFEQIVG